MHAPTDAARMLERTRNQLIERVHEQLALTDRREEGERGHDRLGRDASFDRLSDAARGEAPEPFPQRAELCRDGGFGKSDECAEAADAELAEPAMRVGVEREDGDRLRSEKPLLLAERDDDRFTRFGATRGNPGDELAETETKTERWNDGTMDRTSRFAHSIIPSFHHSTYRINNFPRRPENPLQSISPDICQPQLSGLNDWADFIQRREHAGEAVVVMDRIGFDEPQRGTETDRLTDRHSRLHAGMAGERGDLPQLACGVGSEQGSGVTGQSLMARLFAAEREEGDPNAGGERARRTSRH